MPLDVESFQPEPENSLDAGGPISGEVIRSFPAADPDQAFTPKHTHEGTDIPRGGVDVIRSRLDLEELVDG